ncbi:MAG: class I SAM-dependent methyltransferase [Acidimicrobiales bacterium]
MSSLTRSLSIANQRLRWTRRAESWDHSDMPGLDRVVDAILEKVPAGVGQAVDLGSGSGRLSIPLAKRAEGVLAVDVSTAMIDRLGERAAAAGAPNVEGRACPIEQLEVPEGTVDVIASSYALHHLQDSEKGALVLRAAGWLRPGGVLVVGDMMFGRGSSARDREILRSKAIAMLQRGPSGWWRVAKNLVRFGLRVQERPVSPETWVQLFEAAGLVGVRSEPVVAEAAVVWGHRPAS